MAFEGGQDRLTGHEKCRAFFSTDDVSIFQIPKNQAISSNAAVLFMSLVSVFFNAGARCHNSLGELRHPSGS